MGSGKGGEQRRKARRHVRRGDRGICAGRPDHRRLDHKHSAQEPRLLRLGQIARGVVMVVWTERLEDVIRIISARFASRSERTLYRQRLEG